MPAGPGLHRLGFADLPAMANRASSVDTVAVDEEMPGDATRRADPVGGLRTLAGRMSSLVLLAVDSHHTRARPA